MWLQFLKSCRSPEGLSSSRELPRLAPRLSGEPGRPPPQNTTPRVRSPPPRFASREKCVPSRLPYAGRGGDRTIVTTAGGWGRADAHVPLSVFQLVAVAPGKPTFRPSGSRLLCPGSPHRRRNDHLLELGSGRAPFLPFASPAPPGAASAPAAAELPQPLTARPEHLAAWSLGSRGGAGRGERARGGAG